MMRFQKRFSSIAALAIAYGILLLPQPAHAYAFLHELVSSTYGSLRVKWAENDDLVVIPTWLNSSNPAEASQKTISWALCTGFSDGGSSLTLDQMTDNIAFTPANETEAYHKIIDAIKDAVTTWNNASSNPGASKLLFAPGPSNEGEYAAYMDNSCTCTSNETTGGPFCSAPAGSRAELYFIFNDTNWLEDGDSSDYEKYIAFTDVHHTLERHHVRIDAALITLNPHTQGWNFHIEGPKIHGNVSLRGVLTHELGHVISIAHSRISDGADGNTQATMYPFINPFPDSSSTDVETLALDDTVAYQLLYAPNDLVGKGAVSGYVQDLAGPYVRGASVGLLDRASRKMVLSAFSGVSGTFGTPDGTYSISGIPTAGKTYALFVEPINADPSVTAANYSTLLHFADQLGLLYSSFEIESTSDKAFPNVRDLGGFDLESVDTFDFASTPTQTHVNFFISKTSKPPNDDEGLNITFTTNLVAAGDALLRGTTTPTCEIRLSNPAGLWMLDPTTLTVTLQGPDELQANDISSDFGLFSAAATSASYTLPIRRIQKNGTYTLSVGVSSAYPDTYDGITFSQTFTLKDGPGVSYSGGGVLSAFGCGCAVSPTGSSPNLMLLFLILLEMGIVARKRLTSRKG